MTREPWDDWVKTCGEPTVWCGFDWSEIISNYVVLPQQSEAMTEARPTNWKGPSHEPRG